MNIALAGTPFAGRLHHFAEIDSTNTHALREAERGAPHGSVYFADAQTAGRGRGAHSWVSPPGSGLYVSVLLRPSLAPADALWISLATGLAVRSAVLEVSGLAADLRWPNDLLLHGAHGARKFCGILLEMHGTHLVIGIGINVHQRAFPPELSSQATSLAIESGRDYPRQALLITLLLALHRELEAVADHQGILTRLEAQSTWIRGKRVSVDEDGGYSGVTAGLDPRGFLLVDTGQGPRTVRSGGVREAQP